MPDDVIQRPAQEEANQIDLIARDPNKGLDKAYEEVFKFADKSENKDKLDALHKALLEKGLLAELTLKHMSNTNIVPQASPDSVAEPYWRQTKFDNLAGSDGVIEAKELDDARKESVVDQVLLPASGEIGAIAQKDKNDGSGSDKISIKDLVADAKEAEVKREKPVGLGASTAKVGTVDHLTPEKIKETFGDKFSEAKIGVKITRMDIVHFPEGDLKIGYNGDEQVLYDGNNLYVKLAASNAIAKARGGAGWFQMTDMGKSLGRAPYKMPHDKYNYDENTQTFYSCDNDGYSTKGWRTKEADYDGIKFAAGQFSGYTDPSGAFRHRDTSGNIDLFRYADGSLLLAHYVGAKLNYFIEKSQKNDEANKDKKWVLDDGSGDFIYNDPTGVKHVRKGLQLDQTNGILTFRNEENKNITITGDHKVITQEPNTTALKFDEQGQQVTSHSARNVDNAGTPMRKDAAMPLLPVGSIPKNPWGITNTAKEFAERTYTETGGETHLELNPASMANFANKYLLADQLKKLHDDFKVKYPGMDIDSNGIVDNFELDSLGQLLDKNEEIYDSDLIDSEKAGLKDLTESCKKLSDMERVQLKQQLELFRKSLQDKYAEIELAFNPVRNQQANPVQRAALDVLYQKMRSNDKDEANLRFLSNVFSMVSNNEKNMATNQDVLNIIGENTETEPDIELVPDTGKDAEQSDTANSSANPPHPDANPLVLAVVEHMLKNVDVEEIAKRAAFSKTFSGSCKPEEPYPTDAFETIRKLKDGPNDEYSAAKEIVLKFLRLQPVAGKFFK